MAFFGNFSVCVTSAVGSENEMPKGTWLFINLGLISYSTSFGVYMNIANLSLITGSLVEVFLCPLRSAVQKASQFIPL